MTDTRQWKYFVLGYRMGKSARGNPCWIEIGGDEEHPESISDSLAQFGKDGWELVSTVYLSDGPEGQEIMCFFKKPA